MLDENDVEHALKLLGRELERALARAEAELAAAAAALIARWPNAAAVGIDIPIGLPRHTVA